MTLSTPPLSPHLQIYKPQMTSVLSIFHRATGVLLFLSSALLVYWLAAAAYGPEAYAHAQAFFHSKIGKLGMMLWSFFMYYHLCNGIRHLVWDTGRALSMTTATRFGYLVLLASVALTGVTWTRILG